ncbi:heavy-metal-associated domain-containing protein [Aquisediminimonas sediminicola]|uniref:heavy-metal-associated domain-containing protein n=1 Tax=Alteraquisediminimonas sediminicola TaxID=2676787 RepID=UPI001FE58798|nr:heavy-metal-associated domain-containing protein [Aquisediminimonas sediminicola]
MLAPAISNHQTTLRVGALLRRYGLVAVAFLALALGATGLLRAQIEGTDRGVPPIDSSGSFEVTGVVVDVASKSSEAARIAGWREAQRRAWRALWAKMNGGTAPTLSDSALDGIVSAVVVEEEFIAPRRYIARLGVLFDRARAGQLLGITGQVTRSAPMLVLPVQWIGTTPQSFESRTEWQKAWARFRAGSSPIDYVRPTGTGADPLLLNAAQSGRPGRGWWRMLLDQYGAADVIIPEVRLTWHYPGGPVIGIFTVRHGPDGQIISRFTLRVGTDAAIAKLMDEGVKRVDVALTQAMAEGRLHPDPSLIIEPEPTAEELVESANEQLVDDEFQVVTPSASTQSFSLQIDTPDSASVAAAETQLRGMFGVRSLNMGSLAIGGTSVYRIGYDGNLDALRTALAARGWQVDSTGSGLIIRKARTGQ